MSSKSFLFFFVFKFLCNFIFLNQNYLKFYLICTRYFGLIDVAGGANTVMSSTAYSIFLTKYLSGEYAMDRTVVDKVWTEEFNIEKGSVHGATQFNPPWYSLGHFVFIKDPFMGLDHLRSSIEANCYSK